MIRRLFKSFFILLLIVGCDNSTEAEVHQLVGVWEVIEQTETTIEDTPPIVTEYDVSATYIFNDGGIFSLSVIINGQTQTDNGTWTATDNKLTIIDSQNWTGIMDYSITENILTLTNNVSRDSVLIKVDITLQKQ